VLIIKKALAYPVKVNLREQDEKEPYVVTRCC